MCDVRAARKAAYRWRRASSITYPLPEPAERDPRFTFVLLVDVIGALERGGYPRPRSGDDWVYLQEALYRFLYGVAAPR